MTYPSDKKVPNSKITDCKNTLYPDLHAVFRQLNLSRYAEGDRNKRTVLFRCTRKIRHRIQCSKINSTISLKVSSL